MIIIFCFCLLTNSMKGELITASEFEQLAAQQKLEEAAQKICPIFQSDDDCFKHLSEVENLDELVIEPIGQGGLAQVFMVNNMYVVKSLKPEDRDLHFAVLREIHMGLLIFSFNFSNLMPVEKCCIVREDSQRPLGMKYYTKMELMRYQDLGRILTKDENKGYLKRFDWKFRVLMGATKALALLHENGFVHRDIKPENILMRSPYIPVLADFNGSYNSWFGTPGIGIFGTPGYIPPEVIEDYSYGYATDIFALGKVFFQVMNTLNTRGVHIGRIDIPNYCNQVAVDPVFSLFKLESQFYCEHMEPLVLKMISNTPDERPPIKTIQATLEMLLPFFQNVHSSLARLKNMMQNEEAISLNDKIYLSFIQENQDQPIVTEKEAVKSKDIGDSNLISASIQQLNNEFEAMTLNDDFNLI